MSDSARVRCDDCGRERAAQADDACWCNATHGTEVCASCDALCWVEYGGDCVGPDWRSRALAAEQRAEAAEAERDRMRAALDALPRYMLYLTGHSGSALVTHAVNPHGAWVKAEDVTAIDAYRAGQPATSEAERIAAWLIREESDDTSRGQFACFLADQIRAGAWRKS